MTATLMQGVRPIETTYKGYRFRSRLEARWAVFFDSLGVRWEYEKEGFELGPLGWYLPDFWLPDLGVWYEVKGVKPTDDEAGKAKALGELTQSKTVIAWGEIPLLASSGWSWCSDDDSAWLCWPYWDGAHWWCECPDCGRIGIEFEGRAARLPCGCDMSSNRGHNPGSTRLVAAYTAARSARFDSKRRCE